MFNVNSYRFSVVLSKEDTEILEEIYEDGKREGYDDGYGDGEAASEDYVKEQQAEWIETGHDDAISDFLEDIGYSNLVRLQEKTNYHICFGTDINLEEAVKAIKVLIEK